LLLLGPDDNGEVVDGPGLLARKAFIDGVEQVSYDLKNYFSFHDFFFYYKRVVMVKAQFLYGHPVTVVDTVTHVHVTAM
jgi:hypothetical protein